MFILTIMFITSGLILAGLSVPLILRKIPPNGIYGFRVKKTMEHPEIWYPVNAYGGKWLLAVGIGIVLAAVIFASIPGLTLDVYAYWVLGVLVLLFTLAVFATVRFMKAL